MLVEDIVCFDIVRNKQLGEIMSLESIKYMPLKEAIIGMQNDYKFAYYGFFCLYFKFVEDEEIPAAGGVTVVDRSTLVFAYNSGELEKFVKKYGDKFLRFFVVHEVNHILLQHILRVGERDKQLSNIAQDMIINSLIKKDFDFSFDDFFYVENNYPQLNYRAKEYTDPHVFEFLYDFLFDKKETSKKNKGSGEGKLVDDHSGLGEIDESTSIQIDSIIKSIHDSLKQRGFLGTNGIEEMFKIKKKKSIVNVFKRVFTSGSDKFSSYQRLSRRNSMLKGKKKIGKDINLILDTSGSLYNELDKCIGNIIGNYNIFLIQVDTEVTFSGYIKSLARWKNVKKCGGGGTTLQPAIDFLIKNKRHRIPIFFVSDYISDILDFKGIESKVTFIKSEDSQKPSFKNCSNFKIIS